MRTDHRRGPIAAVGLLTALLISTTTAVAQDQGQGPKPTRPDSPKFLQPPEVAFTAKVEPTRARPGQTVTFSVTASVKKPWHIYAHAEELPEGVAAVPTRFEVFGLGGLEPTGEGWIASETPTEPPPLGEVIVFDYHEGAVTWSRSLTVPEDAEPGAVSLQSQVMFQLCTDTTCKPPTRRTIEPVELTISGEQQREQARNVPRPAILASLLCPLVVPAQEDAKPAKGDSPPVLQPKEATFSTSIEPAEARPGDTVHYNVTVKLAPTWHIYAYAESIPEGVAAVPTRFDAFGLDGLEKAGDWTASREPHEPEEVSGVLAYKYYEDEVTWTLPLKVPADARGGEHSVRTQIQFQICDPKSCKPPTRVTLPAAMLTVLASAGGAPAAGPIAQESASEAVASPGSEADAVEESTSDADATAAAPASDRGLGSVELQEVMSQGLVPFMIWSALGGLVALMMPCVWPMIPITVNFFVKQGQPGPGKGEPKKSTTGLAITYCLAIIGIFTLVGVVFSAFFGAAALNQLSNSPWLNFMVAGLFLAFGLSLLGLFEIRLPNFLLNASAQGESRGGVIGVMFMALTLTITSFTCTFPVVGALLVLAAGGSYLYPVIGLATFATVLALPFFLLALAPGILSSMPRSGDWMNSVKVVGGLVEIGAAFKFLNTAEVSLRGNPEAAWFDAQVLMAAWVVIAAVCGFYLLGFFRTSHDHDTPSVGVGRLMLGSFFLFLALYFSPALFGYPPKSQIYDRLIVGLLPADAGEFDAETQLIARLDSLGFSGGGGGGSPAEPRELIADSDDPPEVQRARALHGVWWDMSLDVALAKAKETNQPVLIDFTGVNCANCRLMEKSVMPRNEVIERLRKFVPVQLYVDRVPVEGIGPDQSEELAVRNLMKEIELTQESTQPLYVVMTPDGEVVSSKGGYIEPEPFVSYLDRALAEYAELARTAQAGE